MAATMGPGSGRSGRMSSWDAGAARTTIFFSGFSLFFLVCFLLLFLFFSIENAIGFHPSATK